MTKVHIYYGSQTGNTAMLARLLQERLGSGTTLSSLDDVAAASPPAEAVAETMPSSSLLPSTFLWKLAVSSNDDDDEIVLHVMMTSTFLDGGAPCNAQAFCSRLQELQSAKTDMTLASPCASRTCLLH